jgi:hypothetical protein
MVLLRNPAESLAALDDVALANQINTETVVGYFA